MSGVTEPRVAVVGATGAVGNQIVELIAERAFPNSELRLFATQSGAAGTVEAGDDEYVVQAFRDPEDLADFDLAFLAVPEAAALEIAGAAPGPLLIDLSAASRNPSDSTPLVAPGVSGRARIAELASVKLIGIPHPAAHVLTICLDALDARSAFVTAMMGASSMGRSAIARMVEQTTDLLSARLDLEEGEAQRAFNALVREGERAVADRIVAQVSALRAARTSWSAIQVVSIPVLHGTGLTVSATVEDEESEWMARLRAAPGVLLSEEGEPLALTDAVGQEAILARAEQADGCVLLWCVFDNTRLAALDAIWIAETLTVGSPATN